MDGVAGGQEHAQLGGSSSRSDWASKGAFGRGSRRCRRENRIGAEVGLQFEITVRLLEERRVGCSIKIQRRQPTSERPMAQTRGLSACWGFSKIVSEEWRLQPVHIIRPTVGGRPLGPCGSPDVTTLDPITEQRTKRGSKKKFLMQVPGAVYTHLPNF